MVIGVVFSGIAAGMVTAAVSLTIGQPIETTLLAYVTAGLIGSVGFAAVATRSMVDVRP